MEFDYIIVGGGSAGCTMAARLSENPDTKVLLLEAGRDVLPGHEPEDIADTYASSYFNKAYMWPGLKAHWRTKSTSPAVNYDQARVMGGGSSVMGMIALRGTPKDYREWQELGAAGWGWDDVEPFFRKLENDRDDPAAPHGHDGPIPIRRIPKKDWPPLAKAAEQFGQAKGFPFVADMNTDFRDGYGTVPISSSPKRRATTATFYLDEKVRARPNLKIQSETKTLRLLIEGGRAVGVEAERGGATLSYKAGEVIVSSGAIHSPLLLMRSGIGDAASLKAAGIEVVADRRGVGRNLMNHALLFLALNLRPGSRQARSLRPHPTAGFRFSAASVDPTASDLYMNIHSKSSWSQLGEQVANVAPILLKPTSRGRVTLQGSDGPLIEFNFLDTEVDRIRLADAFRLGVDFVVSDAARAHYRAAFPVRFTDTLRRLNAKNSENAVKATVISHLFDLVPGLARMVFTSGSDGTRQLRELVADPRALDAHVLANVGGMFHVAGTCRMGAQADPDAVTDPAGRVHGVAGLRVVDASLMPTLPRGNTNIPTIMIAEKIAAGMMAAGGNEK